MSFRKCHIVRPFRLLYCKRPSSSLHTSHSGVLKLVEDAVSSINRAFFSLKCFSSLSFRIPFSSFIFQPYPYLFKWDFFMISYLIFPKHVIQCGADYHTYQTSERGPWKHSIHSNSLTKLNNLCKSMDSMYRSEKKRVFLFFKDFYMRNK